VREGSRRLLCLSPDELVYVEDRRQQEVHDDHERGQTQGNDYTSESVTWPDRRPNDHRRGKADRKPGCRKLHVTEHEVTTLAHGISLRTAAAPDRYTDNARPPHPIDGIADAEGFAARRQAQVCKSVLGVFHRPESGKARTLPGYPENRKGPALSEGAGPLRSLRLLEVCARRHGFAPRRLNRKLPMMLLFITPMPP
jgi:hypothetical protein